MNRLPNLNAKKIIQALKRAGFVNNGQKGSHRYFWNPISNYQTVVPIHSGDVRRGLMKEIIRQAGLSEGEFRKFL